ncbi:hypothetical protein ANANG_G00290600, partial [Anguilla anguilla]
LLGRAELVSPASRCSAAVAFLEEHFTVGQGPLRLQRWTPGSARCSSSELCGDNDVTSPFAEVLVRRCDGEEMDTVAQQPSSGGIVTNTPLAIAWQPDLGMPCYSY